MRKIIIAIILIVLPLVASAQDVGKKKAYFFYGDQCPHCHKVDDYFKANGVYDKYDITKLEFSNPFNARLLLKFGDVYNDPDKGAVPAMAFADKFIVGDQPIIDNFAREIDAADASTLPDPDKINKDTAQSENQIPMGNYENDKKRINRQIFEIAVIIFIVIISTVVVYLKSKKKTNS